MGQATEAGNPMAGATRKSRAILAETHPPLAGFEVFVALAIVSLLAWSLWRVLQELQGHPYRRTQNPTQLTNQIAGLLEMGEARGAATIARDTIPRLIQSDEDVRVRRRAAILAGTLATSKAPLATDKMKKALVNALGDPDRYLRRLAIASLLKMNGGESFGYDPDAPRRDYAAAQKNWRKWLQPRRGIEPSAAQADQRPKPPAGIDKEALRRQIERKLGIQPTWGPRIENLPADLRE